MEEKERFEWNSRFDEAIKDNQTGDIVNAVEVLNKQDKRIKDLEDLVIEYKNKLYRRLDQVDNLIEKNKQLKQQLYDLPKKIVEEIKKVSDTVILWWSSEVYDYTITAKNLDTILKKYGGKDEINND